MSTATPTITSLFHSVEWNEVLVLVIAGTLANFTRGLTGFGGAIILLTVWATASLFISVPPLPALVMLDGFLGCVTTLPMSFSVNFKQTSRLLLISFLPLQSIFVPVGALLLKICDPSYLEIATGFIVCGFVIFQSGVAQMVFNVVYPPSADPLPTSSSPVDDEEKSTLLSTLPPPTTTPPETKQKQQQSFHSWLLETNTPDTFAYKGSRLSFVAICCAAGILSGIIGGVCGVHGPPIIAVYSLIQMDKDSVRATSTAISIAVITVRVISYLVFGLFHIQIVLYSLCSCGALVGLYAGIEAARRVDGQSFQRIMMVVLCMGGALLLYKVITVRVISYLVFGLFHIQIVLYSLCSCGALVGLYAGIEAARRVDGQSFQRIMMVVLCMGGALLLYKVITVRVISYLVFGLFHIQIVLYSLCSCGALVGLYAGIEAARRVDGQSFQRIMMVVLCMGGALLLYKGATATA
ncbi:transmembrane sulfite exporter TauE/SafE [Pseudoscourfieldia marina]